jgi:transposase
MGGGTSSGRAPIPREKILAAYRAGPEAIVSLIQYLQDLHEAELGELRAMIDTLSQQVKQLQEQLHADSHNSSKPPSSDGPARRAYVKREKSKRKPGGQPGHEGTTLQRTATPDEVVVHRATRCRCGHSLRQQPVEGYTKRQVFEIPRVSVKVTEHQAEIKRCPACGRASQGQFPPAVKRAVQYGENLRSYVIYLKDYTLVPYQRLRQLMKDLFGVPLSSATLFAAEQQCARGLKDTVQQIRREIVAAAVGHFDETGLRVQGKVSWLHSASTKTATYYYVHPRRGRQAMDAMGVLGAFAGVAVHDGWTSYARYGKLHGLCNAHHLRELTFLWEEGQQRWAQLLARELRHWKRLVDRAKDQGRDHLCAATVRSIEWWYGHLVHMGMRANPPPAIAQTSRRGRKKRGKAGSLVDRLWENRAHVLRFVHDFRVPFDNNLAERDLRMMKVQQKISGTFRSWEGAEAFATVRSYISTIRKRGTNVIQAIASVFEGKPLLPAAPASC